MLRIENLAHVYPNGTRAIDGVTLSVPRGMFGLLGPNGAGKSSLMRCIATLQIPTQGAIRFGDIDVLKNPDALRRTLGYLPQDFGVYPRVTALGDARSPRRARRDSPSAASDAKTSMHCCTRSTCGTCARKALAGFSGGMRQRFGIAQALIGQPQLIIVDEPTAGLDPEERNRFLNLLAEIGENVVVILSTHIVEDVADLCPSMAIISNGRIVRTGAPADLIARTRGPRLAQDDRQGPARCLSARPRGHRHATFRRAHRDPRARRRSIPATASSRCRADWKTCISRRSRPRAAKRPETRHVPLRRQLRAALPAQVARVLDNVRHLPAAHVRRHGLRQRARSAPAATS